MSGNWIFTLIIIAASKFTHWIERGRRFQDPFVNVISYRTRNIKSMLILPVTKYLDANAACHNGLLLSNGAF